jgi:hypothetical protein
MARQWFDYDATGGGGTREFAPSDVIKHAHDPSGAASQWVTQLKKWIAKSNGTWEFVGGAESDAGPSGWSDNRRCESGVPWYEFSASFESAAANTMEVEVDWRLDSTSISGPRSLTFGVGETGPKTDTYHYSNNSGIHDGNDHGISVRWRRKNRADGTWSGYFTYSPFPVISQMVC